MGANFPPSRLTCHMDGGTRTVLVVEDDERTAAFLADNLRADGYRVAVAAGEVALDPATRLVKVGDRPVQLSAKEFALLHALARQPTRVYSKAELLRDVWGYLSQGQTRTIDAHACRLRKKLGGPRWIVSVRGVGYRLVETA